MRPLYDIPTNKHNMFDLVTPPPLAGGKTTQDCDGGHGERETPGPIPNPEAKPFSADGTAPARVWESRTSPNTPRRSPTHQGAGIDVLNHPPHQEQGHPTREPPDHTRPTPKPLIPAHVTYPRTRHVRTYRLPQPEPTPTRTHHPRRPGLLTWSSVLVWLSWVDKGFLWRVGFLSGTRLL